MSKIIKNVNNFRVRSLLEAYDADDVRDSFMDTLYDVVLSGSIDNIKFSYSYIAAATDKNIKLDPEKDFNRLLDELEDRGWGEQELNELFEKYGDELEKDYNNAAVNNEILTGIIDYFMFKMTNGKILLMGYKSQDIENIKGDESTFKFYYGFNKTPYGKLALAQHFGSLDKFYDYIGENFVNMLSKDNADKNEQFELNSELFRVLDEKFQITDLTKFYDYDSEMNVGRLDLGAAGLDLNAGDEVRPAVKGNAPFRGEDGNLVHRDYDVRSSATLHKLFGEFLASIGAPLDDKTDKFAGGYSELDGSNNVILIHFGGKDTSSK